MKALRHRTGVVVPVFLPDDVQVSVGESLLSDTIEALVHQVDDPSVVCLSVDGSRFGQSAARTLSEKLAVSAIVSDHNRGKLAAVRDGMGRLLDNPALHYFAVVDQDGDHFANELLNFVRAAEHVQSTASSDMVLVLGRRISRHKPMGFARGELEDLANRVLLQALRYRAATSGSPIPLQFALGLDDFPDFHSGYKLFTRAAAVAVFTTEPRLCGVTDECYYRHGCEAVMSVEAIERGAYLAVVNRSTLDEQPVSAFGLLDRQRLVADKVIWACKRLDVPGVYVAQWLRDHMPQILLRTLLPEGKEELLQIRRMILSAFDIRPDSSLDEGEIVRMPFV